MGKKAVSNQKQNYKTACSEKPMSSCPKPGTVSWHRQPFFPSALVATGANAHPSAGTALRIAMTKWIKFGPY